jgi:hypothetical protein
VGEVAGPEVQLLQAQRDLAWAVMLDEMDLPYVVRFRVESATAAPRAGSYD